METSVADPHLDENFTDPDPHERIESILPHSQDYLQNVVAFPVAFTNAALHEVQLLKLLHEIGAPNHAFQSLMSWARQADENDYHFQPSPMAYESQIRNLTQLVGMTSCRPTVSKVSLEPDDIVLDVVVFPFATMLASLLNCPMLNKLENLVINPDDPYGRCPGQGLGEVNTAQWYQDTYDRMILNPGKDFLCPIIFAMDKTVISEISHLSVNVILFSTTLFNQEVSTIERDFLPSLCLHSLCFVPQTLQTRNKSIAWRPLAYIPDQDLHYSIQQRKKTPAAVKQIRLFKLFNAGIQSFIEAQQPEALNNIYLQLGDKAKYVNLKIPLAFIIGDNQGGDQIAGRICHYGLHAKRISRTCDATPENYADVSKDSCSFLVMEDIKELVLNEEWEVLESLYQAQCWNPFFDVDYGANKWGIFLAACPPEALHALEQGVFKHLLESILGDYLKPVQITLLDRVIQTWTLLPRQKLFRSSNFPEAPRLLFKDGISSLKQTPGCDRAGMVFALMVASLTRDGSDAFVKLADDDATKITYVLEMLLCYWAWLKLDTFWDRSNVEQYESVKDAVSTLLGELISCVPRETGNGWDIPKIHEQLHIPCYIQMFGAHRNLHTGPAENNHIALSKKPAARTQKRSHVFDWQVSNRLIDKLVVDLASFTMEEHVGGSPTIPCVSEGVTPSSATFDILFWVDISGQVHADLKTPKVHRKYMPPMNVLHCLSDYCIQREDVPTVEGKKTIRCYTETIVNGIYLRTNPSHRDGPWFDNVITNAGLDQEGESGELSGGVKFMFCFPDHSINVLFGVLHPAYGFSPVYSVITKMYRMEFLDDPEDIMIELDRDCGSWILDNDRASIGSCPRLMVIPLSTVLSHLLLIPYHDASKFMIGIISQTRWADLFVTY